MKIIRVCCEAASVEAVAVKQRSPRHRSARITSRVCCDLHVAFVHFCNLITIRVQIAIRKWCWFARWLLVVLKTRTILLDLVGRELVAGSGHTDCAE